MPLPTTKFVQYVSPSGQPIDIAAAMTEGYRQRYLEGKALQPKRKPTAKNGYAALPGTGPAGEICKTCRHKVTASNGGAKSFIKCLLRKATWTHGPGTDILAHSPACNKWQAIERAPTDTEASK